MGALGRLTSLQSLRLDYDSEFGWDVFFSTQLTELAPLTGHTSLVLGGYHLEPAAWATLAQLPQLARLEIDSMLTPPLAQAAPLAALTSLVARTLCIPAGAAAGWLCAVLPSLVQLELRGDDQVDVWLLQGHPSLRRLHLMMEYSFWASEPWQPLLLCTMPQLREVWVEGYFSGGDLLADLAACTGLRSIRVLWRAHGFCNISAAGIRALAGAASSGTLESIVLGRVDEVWFGAQYSAADRLALADALPLLQARMPRLRELRVPVLRVGARRLGALAQQMGRPPEVVRAQLGLDVEGMRA
jgi:hypothetical protein